jgi:hypothetical protein
MREEDKMVLEGVTVQVAVCRAAKGSIQVGCNNHQRLFPEDVSVSISRLKNRTIIVL